MFSIVIPLYNKEQSVKNTVESVLRQTVKDFEIVIINDGSTDRSVEVIEEINESRIRLIHQKNQGVSVARNKGIKEAQRDWIVFLDADDLWEENHLEALKSMIERYPRDKVFCTSFIKSNQQKPAQSDNSIVVIENYFKEVIKNNFFWTSVTCLHQTVFDSVGMFDERISRGEDMDLWTRVGREYRIVKSNLITAVYRIEAENRSNLHFNLDRSRVYHYDFGHASSMEEVQYYKTYIAGSLRGMLRNRDFISFIRLSKKHFRNISFVDIFRK